MKRILYAVLCAMVAISLLFSGCGTNNSSGAGSTNADVTKSSETTAGTAEPVSLRVLLPGNGDSDPQVAPFKKNSEDFNKNNGKNITTKEEYINSEQYKTKIATEFAANSDFDVFFTYAAGFMKPFVEAGKVLALDEAFQKDPEWKSRFASEGLFSFLTFDNKIYGVPNAQGLVFLFYNREIFEKYGLQVPKTYTELKAAVDSLVKNNITPISLPNKQSWVGGLLSEVIAERIGSAAPFKNIYEGKGTFEDPSYVEVGKTLQELVKMKAFPEGFNGLDYGQGIDLFTQGKAAMLVMGSWAFSDMMKEGSLVKDKVDIVPFPMFENGKGDVDTFLGQPDYCIAVSANTKNRDASLLYLKSFSGPVFQKAFAETGNIIAIKTDLSGLDINPLVPKANELTKNMKDLFVFYDTGLGATVGGEYNNTIQGILAGKDPADSFKKLTEFAKQNAGK